LGKSFDKISFFTQEVGKVMSVSSTTIGGIVVTIIFSFLQEIEKEKNNKRAE
jgi:hypothetical protein